MKSWKNSWTMSKKIIGLLFGSFNPVHSGHLMLAQYLVEFSELEEVWFVVSPQNPFKKKKTLLNDHHRDEMVRIALEDNDRFEVSNIEFRMPKPSYTIDTLTHLSEKYPGNDFRLICGTDILPTFHKWKNYEQIIDNYNIMVYNRPGDWQHPYENHPSFQFINAPLFDISSSFIRKAIKEKKNLRYFLPDNVYKYILEMHFYE